ncbi:MAG: hypothetical protein IKS83_07105 [Victivallales bacterium]|nr:hypothetical protein [Victivallales bacterium]
MVNYHFNQGFWAAPDDSEKLPNTFALNRILPTGEYILQIAASGLYRLRINGEVVAYGPARSPKGYARVDELTLGPWLTKPQNRLVLEVVNYTSSRYYIPVTTPFFALALLAPDGSCESGPTGWQLHSLPFRDWNAPELTFQRDLMESYDLTLPGATEWYDGAVSELPLATAVPAEIPAQGWLSRGAPLPRLDTVYPVQRIGGGKLACLGKSTDDANDLRTRLEHDYQWQEGGLAQGEPESYTYYDLGAERTGFWRFRITAETDCEVVLSWDEVPGPDGVFSIMRFTRWAQYYIRLRLKAGETIAFESFEPYTARYAAVLQLHGHAKIEDLAMREYAFDRNQLLAEFREPPADVDDELRLIYHAAVETFRQNTMDIFLDCPGRERGGWLCDSFFISRAAYLLTGSNALETTFLENFLLPEHFDTIPDGELPDCYPATEAELGFIPQWTLWFWIEMAEYMEQRGGRDFPRQYADHLQRCLAHFDSYRNEFGLLEGLPGWNFIEWSKSQEYMDGCNFPTNMLYCKFLRIAAKWLDEPELASRAEAMRREILARSFDGQYFHDHAVRQEDGTLQTAPGTSEICQYYADFCGVIDETQSEWQAWRKRLLETQSHPTLDGINMFIGRILRFERLAHAKMRTQLLDEIREHLGPMARLSGTLWEADNDQSSLCHGFAAYAACLIRNA